MPLVETLAAVDEEEPHPSSIGSAGCRCRRRQGATWPTGASGCSYGRSPSTRAARRTMRSCASCRSVRPRSGVAGDPARDGPRDARPRYRALSCTDTPGSDAPASIRHVRRGIAPGLPGPDARRHPGLRSIRWLGDGGQLDRARDRTWPWCRHVEARSFAEMLEQTVRRYQNRAIEAAQVIEEPIGIAREPREAIARLPALEEHSGVPRDSMDIRIVSHAHLAPCFARS